MKTKEKGRNKRPLDTHCYIGNKNLTACTTTFTTNPCKHDTGWYHTINIWIFSKRIFVCEKCFAVLDAKTMMPI